MESESYPDAQIGAADSVAPANLTTRFVGELYPFQSDGVEFLTSRKRRLLADDVGLGKTVQIAAAIGRLWDGELSRQPGIAVLYVTAAALVEQTTVELKHWLPSLSVTAGGGRGNGGQPTNVLVLSQEFAHANAALIRGHKPYLVVVDEASALKGGGVEFETIRSLCDAAERVMIATATPFENHPLELWTVFELVGHDRLGDQDEFLDRYCRVGYFRDGSFKVEGWRSDARARDAIAAMSRDFLRRTAGDVGLRLPEREETAPVLVPLTAEQRVAYQRAGRIRQPLSRHRKQQDAARGAGVSSPLFREAVGVVAGEVGEQRKVVLHAERMADLDALSELLTASGIRHVSIRGATSRADRRDAVLTFRDDPGMPVLLGSRVLEYGLNLQFANTLVSVGVSYNPARERQREGRLRRIGSPHASYRHWIVLPDTDQTQKQLATLSYKSAGAAHVLGD